MRKQQKKKSLVVLLLLMVKKSGTLLLLYRYVEYGYGVVTGAPLFSCVFCTIKAVMCMNNFGGRRKNTQSGGRAHKALVLSALELMKENSLGCQRPEITLS